MSATPNTPKTRQAPAYHISSTSRNIDQVIAPVRSRSASFSKNREPIRQTSDGDSRARSRPTVQPPVSMYSTSPTTPTHTRPKSIRTRTAESPSRLRQQSSLPTRLNTPNYHNRALPALPSPPQIPLPELPSPPPTIPLPELPSTPILAELPSPYTFPQELSAQRNDFVFDDEKIAIEESPVETQPALFAPLVDPVSQTPGPAYRLPTPQSKPDNDRALPPIFTNIHAHNHRPSGKSSSGTIKTASTDKTYFLEAQLLDSKEKEQTFEEREREKEKHTPPIGPSESQTTITIPQKSFTAFSPSDIVAPNTALINSFPPPPRESSRPDRNRGRGCQNCGPDCHTRRGPTHSNLDRNPKHAPRPSTEWKTDMCDTDTSCFTGLFCPCILYGRNEYRLSQKAKGNPVTDLLGYSPCNSACGLWSIACGFQWLLTSIQRTRVRKAYDIDDGRISNDVGSSCLCCCFTIAQSEREMLLREKERKKIRPMTIAYKTDDVKMMYPPPPSVPVPSKTREKR